MTLPALPPQRGQSMNFGKPGRKEGPRPVNPWKPVVSESSPWLSISGLVISVLMGCLWYWIKHR